MTESIGTGNANNIYAGNAYSISFGNLPNETMYHAGMSNGYSLAEGKSYDAISELLSQTYSNAVEHKALGPYSGGAGTAGYAMIPVYLDPIIHDESRKRTPLVESIRRVTNQGITADYNVMTAKGAAFTSNPDGAMDEADNTVTRRSKQIKYLYAVGRVLGPAQAAIPSFMLGGIDSTGAGTTPGSGFSNATAGNAKQLEVLSKARSLKEHEENLIVNGDSSTTPTQFDGFVIQQSTTNKLDLGGDSLTWDDVEQCAQYAFDDGGHPTLGVCSPSVFRQLRKIMIDQFRVSQTDLSASLTFGVPSGLVINAFADQMLVIPSQYLSDTAGSRSFYMFDMDYMEMRVLQDMTYEELAKTNDSSKFLMKIYEALVLKAPAFNSWIGNIA